MQEKRNHSKLSRDSTLPTESYPERFSSSMGSKMVDLIVRPERKLFHVHKRKLCQIPYFSKMFRGGFREAIENMATFPEDDADAFDVFLFWIYYDRFPTYSSTCDEEGKNVTGSWDRSNVYGLAVKFCIPEFGNAVMDVVRKVDWENGMWPAAGFVRRVYDCTQERSPLRKYAVRWMWYYLHGLEETSEGGETNGEGPGQDDARNIDELAALLADPDISKDFVKVVINPPRIDPRIESNCAYHFHEDNSTCTVNQSESEDEAAERPVKKTRTDEVYVPVRRNFLRPPVWR